ncbi:MAG: M23 family metallopeptidase [Candidatus Hydrogenedentes bacterium]|nr:M23 family metallopeptidase [Candidatus Hydrogenedentota bacterium]
MKQHYFILVLAHSFHGRLRRLHIPHQAVYVVLALAVLGAFSVIGMASSYARMAWKVANYNSLQTQFDTLRNKYQQLQKSADQTNEQLATLQVFASEVSLAYGVKRRLEGPPDIAGEGPLLPTFDESIEQYNFLKSATFSRTFHKYPKAWQANVRPSLWPIHGRLLSSFGRRTDPFSGEGAFHAGVDISARAGTPVRATADGIVAHADWSGAYGRLVVVDHGGGMHTYYAHLSRIDVIPGQEVRRSQLLGASGATGRATSPHLHYEVRQNGTPINPYVFLARSSTGETAARDLPF